MRRVWELLGCAEHGRGTYMRLYGRGMCVVNNNQIHLASENDSEGGIRTRDDLVRS